MTLRLPGRLMAAFVTVQAIGTVVSLVTVRALAPGIFDRQMGMAGGRMPMGASAQMAQTRLAFIAALDQALAAGLLVSAVLAGAAAVFLARSVLHPLDQVRAAAGQIASGCYDVRVPAPSEPDVAALAADVNTLAQTLADTETRRLRLLGEVAHEMRTPLTGLSGYVDGMLDGVFTADERTLGAMSTDLARLRRLAEDLSALSSSQEGRTTIDAVPCDLGGLAREVCTSLGATLRPVILDVHTEGPAPVLADPDRIGQVLTNLLTNAARAQRTGTVHVSTTRDRTTARLTVTDTGPGLATDELDRVFERFYRVPGTIPGAGTGIGLTIARAIAHAHHGTLTATSPGLGHGATFTLTLPLAPA